MTTQTTPQDPAPRQMTCVRRLYVMEDDAGRTWLAAEEVPGDGPAEGGAMSHRVPLPAPGEAPDGSTGGAMSHLVPGETAEVEGDHPDQVTVVVPPKPGGMPHRMPAYRVSPALLPPAAESPGS